LVEDRTRRQSRGRLWQVQGGTRRTRDCAAHDEDPRRPVPSGPEKSCGSVRCSFARIRPRMEEYDMKIIFRISLCTILLPVLLYAQAQDNRTFYFPKPPAC